MTECCRGDKPVFLLGEDGDSRGLEHSDLNQSAVDLHRFTVIKGDDKQLHHRRKRLINQTKMRSVR